MIKIILDLLRNGCAGWKYSAIFFALLELDLPEIFTQYELY